MMGGRQWFHEPIRLVHTILRSCDAAGYDAKAYLDYAERMRGNTVVINGGGLYAFYPTKIDLHHIVSGLTSDVVGDVVAEAHRRGIKVLARVDFRGAHRDMFDAHRDWFSYGANGEPVVSNGFYVAPVISPYRNEGYGFRVVRELMENYDLDGIWENAPGFFHASNRVGGRISGRPNVAADREGVEAASFGLIDYGPSVRRRFEEETGHRLPTPDDFDPEVYGTYMRWRHTVMQEHATAFRDLVKSYGEDKAYVAEFPAMLDVSWGRTNAQDTANIAPLWDIVTAPTFDILRGSYGSALYPTPVWRAEESAKFLAAANPSVPPTVLFGRFDNQSRYSTVGSEELRIWLAGALAHGAGYWECTFVGRHGEEFLDRRNEDIVADYYGLLADKAEYYRDAKSGADIAVVHSHRSQDHFGSDDPRDDGYVGHMRGVLSTLFAEHLPFDILPERRITREELARYRVVVLPNTAILDEEQCAAIRAYVEAGGGVVASFETSLYTPDGRERSDYGLADLFGVSSGGVVSGPMPYAYTLIRERNELTAGLEETKVVTNTGRIRVVNALDGVGVPATLVPEVVPQPPEHGWRADLETPIPVIATREYGAGRSVLFPGQTDKLAVESGHPDYARLVANAVTWAGCGDPLVRTTAPDSVHISVMEQAESGRRIVHLVNYTSGPRRPIRQVVPCTDITVELRVDSAPKQVRTVRSDEQVEFVHADGRVRFTLPRLDVYEAVAIIP